MWRSPSNGVLCVPIAIFLCQSHTDTAPWGFVLRADKTPNIYPGTLRDQIQDARPKYHAGPRRSKRGQRSKRSQRELFLKTNYADAF